MLFTDGGFWCAHPMCVCVHGWYMCINTCRYAYTKQNPHVSAITRNWMLRSLQGPGALMKPGGGSAYDPYVTAASALCLTAMHWDGYADCWASSHYQLLSGGEGVLHLSAVGRVAVELLLHHLSPLLLPGEPCSVAQRLQSEWAWRSHCYLPNLKCCFGSEGRCKSKGEYFFFFAIKF